MFKDGDPKGANAIPARATPSPKWQEAIKESGRRDDELSQNSTCPNKHTSTQVGLLSTAVSETPRGYLVATSLGAPRTHTGCTLRPKRAQNSAATVYGFAFEPTMASLRAATICFRVAPSLCMTTTIGEKISIKGSMEPAT